MTLGTDSTVNDYFELFGNFNKFLMFSLSQVSIPAGEYDDFMLFRFPMTAQGSKFCILGDDSTVMRQVFAS